jgi:hypothetical protein
MTEKRARCWACNRFMKEVDIWNDLCNRCTTLKPDPEKVLKVPNKDHGEIA